MKLVAVLPGVWMNNFVESPVLWIFPLLGFFCPLLTVMAIYRGRPGWGFLMASLMQFGVIFTAGITLFPFVMPSSVSPISSLTLWVQPDVVGQHFQSADAEHYVGNRADIFAHCVALHSLELLQNVGAHDDRNSPPHDDRNSPP